MSRTSPGRYALHEFAKNVFDVRVRDGKGTALVPSRPDLHQWDVAGHDGTVVSPTASLAIVLTALISRSMPRTRI